jgi:outer membrane protein assembly factor BamB
MVLRHQLIATLSLGFLCTAPLVAQQETSVRMKQWPHWRGPLATGVAPDADPPTRWDKSTNIRWKAEVPGEGSASPIVWQDRIFVAAAIPTDRKLETPVEADPSKRTKPPETYYQFVIICFDRESGQQRWQRVATEAVPHEGRHPTNTYASGSPTTDGERLFVSFGSRGIFCYDLDGNPLWERSFGPMQTRLGWGEAVTPVVHENLLIVNWDQETDSFIAALDARTGQEVWRVDRDEATTWTTPLVVPYEGSAQVIVNGTNRVRSYNLADGQLIWECGGQTVNPIPSPTIAEGVVYCVSGYRGAAAYAIPLSARGDITDSETILWSHHRSTPYVPSPLVYGEQIYFTQQNEGILTSLDRSDGSVIFGPKRLPDVDQIYASPVAAQGRIYIVGRDGTTLVLEHGDELKVLATNRLDDPIDASPALVDRQLFLRSASHLYCIEE